MAYSDKEKDNIFNDICYKIGTEGKALRNILKEKNSKYYRCF